MERPTMDGEETFEFDAELRGTITRDVKHVTVQAVDEADARAMLAEEHPHYRIHALQRTT
jgi:hypothetical protein